jgi:hypothetical protein
MPRALRPVLLWVGTTLLAVAVTVSGVRLVLRGGQPADTGPVRTRALTGAPGSKSNTPAPRPVVGRGGVSMVIASARPSPSATPTPSPTPTPTASPPTAGRVTPWNDGPGRDGVRVDTALGFTFVVLDEGPPERAQVASTHPVAGASASTSRPDADHVIITFRRDDQRITVDVRWRNGRPSIVTTPSG